ncbi:hypothetical protein C0J52_00109, partial [Blattella germanica]
LKGTSKLCSFQKCKLLNGYRVTLLDSTRHIRSEMISGTAVKMLGAETVIVHKQWESIPDIPQLGKTISALLSDMIVVVFADVHLNVKSLADGARPPVVCLHDNMYEITRVLGDVMTVNDYFGAVRGLRLAYDLPQSPATMEEGLKICRENGTELKECDNYIDAIRKANVIVTSAHNDSKNRIILKVFTLYAHNM